MSIRDLYVKVAAAIEAMPANVKADVDAIFAEHEAAQPSASSFPGSTPGNGAGGSQGLDTDPPGAP